MVWFEAAATDVLNPLVTLWNSFAEIVPGLIAAIIILIIGYIIALLIGHAVRIILEKVGLEKAILKAKLTGVLGKTKLSALCGLVIKWYIIVIFLQAAVDAVNLGTLSIVLNEFVLWLPHLIVGLIVVLMGLFIGHYVSEVIEKHTGMKGARFMSVLFKFLIVFIAVIIAMQQIGIEVGILGQILLIGFGAIGFGIALAIGLSFGLGLKTEAPKLWQNLKKFF